MSTCKFDKRDRFHPCGDPDRDCVGCSQEHIIAKSVVSLCHWCGWEIEARYARQFCCRDHRLEWQSARIAREGLGDGTFWGEPIFDEAKLAQMQVYMLG